MDIRNFIQAWTNTIVPDEAVELIAKHRLDICNQCPEKVSLLNVDCCGKCHCPLVAKSRGLDSVCPLGKWTNPD